MTKPDFKQWALNLVHIRITTALLKNSTVMRVRDVEKALEKAYKLGEKK